MTSSDRPGMPSSLEAERVVLGSVLIDNTTIATAMELLGHGEGFYSPVHREIYESVVHLHDRAIPVDPATVAHELERRGQLENAGGLAYLARLEAAVLSPANIAAHARVVFDKWQLRQLIESCHEIIDEAYHESEPVTELLDRAERDIFTIASSRGRASTAPIAELAREAIDEIEKRSRDRHEVTGVPSGYFDLDSKTGGFQRNDLIIIAARPSMGKTAFALNICQYIALQKRVGVGVFSLEMSAHQLTQRMLASTAKVNLHRVRTGRLDPMAMQALAARAGDLAEAPMYIDDTPGLSILELRSKARKMAHQHSDLGLICVDYLQLMRGGGRAAENRQQEVSEISRSLKELARELKVPVVALSQLSRQSEQRRGKDKRPVLSDLRESGAIEQDADVVMFVHREEYYKRKEAGPSGEQQAAHAAQKWAPEVAEIIIGKQRNGPTGTIELLFLPDLASFVNMNKRPGGGGAGGGGTGGGEH